MMVESSSAPLDAALKVSVILVSYNSQVDLERCLPVLCASLPPEAEIILVDNGSEDGSIDYVQKKHADIHLIRSLTNLGYGVANNLAAGLARGRYLVFLNADTVVKPEWIEGLLRPLEAHQEIGMTTACILLLDDPAKINTCGNDVHISGLTLCRGMGESEDKFSSIEAVAAVSGAAFAIRRELFMRLGGFDESFFLYMEDTDLSLRTRLAGYAVLYLPDAVVQHDYCLVIGRLKVYYQECNRYRMLLKCLRWRTLFALLPVLLLAEVITWGFVLAYDRRNWRNKLLAYDTVRRAWREIMQARGVVQRSRCASDSALLELSSACLDLRQVGQGQMVRLAEYIFNPLFKILRRVALALI